VTSPAAKVVSPKASPLALAPTASPVNPAFPAVTSPAAKVVSLKANPATAPVMKASLRPITIILTNKPQLRYGRS
jgi:hypothetical protein